MFAQVHVLQQQGTDQGEDHSDARGREEHHAELAEGRDNGVSCTGTGG